MRLQISFPSFPFHVYKGVRVMLQKLHSRPAAAPSSPLPTLRHPASPPLRVRKPMATVPGIASMPVTILVHVLGLLSLALVLAWVINWRGGVSLFTSDPVAIFNAHPVIQIGGFIFIFSEAILVYKTLSGTKKTKKLVHLILQGIAFLFSLLGVYAAYKFHVLKDIENFYSLHSWLGVATIILFFIQWVGGFVSFWTQSIGPSARAAALPWHVFFGLVIYALAIATACTGFLEKVTFLSLEKFGAETRFVNCMGLVLVLMGIVTALGAVLPTPKDESDGYQPI